MAEEQKTAGCSEESCASCASAGTCTSKKVDMELLEVREGYAYGRMRMDEHFTNIYGGMHGGCSYALADTLAGVAASTYGNYVTTIDGKMNYLEAVKDTGYVYGEAEVQRQGGRIGVYTVKLMDENQKVLVTADFTYYRTGQAIDQQG